MVLFKDETQLVAKAHPAHMVLDTLAGPNDIANELHATQVSQWYKDYAAMRGLPHLFKESVEPSFHVQSTGFEIVLGKQMFGALRQGFCNSASQFQSKDIDQSSDGETIKVPFTHLKKLK